MTPGGTSFRNCPRLATNSFASPNDERHHTYASSNTATQNCFYGLNGVAQNCTIAAYDPLRGDPFFQLDLRLAQNVNFGDRLKVQLVA
jgi:hypothetical protein